MEPWSEESTEARAFQGKPLFSMSLLGSQTRAQNIVPKIQQVPAMASLMCLHGRVINQLWGIFRTHDVRLKHGQ